MRQRNLLVAIALVTVMLMATVGGTLAYWVQESDVTNKIDTDNVHVKLLNTVKQYDSLYPGDVVPHVVDVQNDGDLDALARLKVDKVWISSNLDSSNVKIEYNTNYWLDGGDGYFYYKGILAPGQKSSEPLFEEFVLDSSTGNEYKKQELRIDVKLQYIQAANNAIEAMWNKTYQDIGVNAPQYTAGTEVAKVTFVSPEQEFTFGQEDNLFLNFKNLAPGDERSQVIDVTNSYQDEIEVFIRAAQVNQNATGQDLQLINNLLQKHATITVVRTDTGQTLYEGAIWGNYTTDPVGNNSMKNDISLGAISSKATKSLKVTMKLAPEIENEYQDLAANIGWVFRAQDTDIIDPPPTIPGDTPTPLPPTGEPTPTPVQPTPTLTTPTPGPTYTPLPTGSPVRPTTTGTVNPPKVGDDSPMPMMLMAIALLTCTLIGLIIAYRRQKKLDRKYR